DALAFGGRLEKIRRPLMLAKGANRLSDGTVGIVKQSHEAFWIGKRQHPQAPVPSNPGRKVLGFRHDADPEPTSAFEQRRERGRSSGQRHKAHDRTRLSAPPDSERLR